MDVEAYAKTMAHALATMHWKAGIDANDVEFVLATPRTESEVHGGKAGRMSKTSACVFNSDALGKHAMWLLDFDCCRSMSMDVEGVMQTVHAIFRNDPYYPRPGQALWDIFKREYLGASSIILKGRIALTGNFIEQVEEH